MTVLSHYNTDSSTHTILSEFDYIHSLLHMSLQKGMGSRGAYTHTQSKGAFLTCVLSRYDVPVQRKLLKPGASECVCVSVPMCLCVCVCVGT